MQHNTVTQIGSFPPKKRYLVRTVQTVSQMGSLPPKTTFQAMHPKLSVPDGQSTPNKVNRDTQSIQCPIWIVHL
jgi:hypothetical protein